MVDAKRVCRYDLVIRTLRRVCRYDLVIRTLRRTKGAMGIALLLCPSSFTQESPFYPLR
jgi:hypothetical protein